MNIVKHEGKRRLFDSSQTLLLMDESTLKRIIEDPAQPLLEREDKGVSGEEKRIYDTSTSLLDICREGQEKGAKRLEVSYDFFFGGSKRENYPDSPDTLNAYKVIYDVAKEHGMRFSASVVSPLDIGGGYAKTHTDVGHTMQFREGEIAPDGSYQVSMIYQTQWTNNKGPIRLTLSEVKVFAFCEERIGDTPYYYVDENEITDISSTASYEIDENSIRTERDGYGHGDIRIFGRAASGSKNRCLVVLVYATPELDYFSAEAGDYMKSIIDKHAEKGIQYAGFYSDEMHIQFDWDLEEHFGPDTEINTRYVTDALAHTYAERFGRQYEDFPKYLVYFAYQQHGFLPGEEGRLPAQHVFGKTREAIVETWLFRKRYFEMLQRRVVDLCKDTKDYAEDLFGGPIMTRAHSTWQESPTCDRFYDSQRFSVSVDKELSRYEYTPAYVWSSSIRENMSACYDYFKWNEYLTGGGTDHPEGGFLDRNYYGCAFAASLALLNRFPFSYYGFWGSPKPVMDRLADVGVTYGNESLGRELAHNLIQGLTPRISEVLTLYPLDLNYLEERFGSWMVQYGYTDYITEDKLLQFAAAPADGLLKVRDRSYRTLMVFCSPLLSAETMNLLKTFVEKGGTVVWCSIPALREDDGTLSLWQELFGIRRLDFPYGAIQAKDKQVQFPGLNTVKPMTILTDFLPDHIYPVLPGEADVIATLKEPALSREADASGEVPILGTRKDYAGGGRAIYLGFRPRDDQSCSLGEDVNTLFSILLELGCYEAQGPEALSRPAQSPYILNRFPNGTVTMANHMRTIREDWYGSFYRDEEKDREILKTVELTPRQICLKEMEILGHKISYEGTGAMSYRYSGEAGLTGFAGRDTAGIQIDGRSYRFAEKPVDLAFYQVDSEELLEGVQWAYAVKCDTEARIRLPFNATGAQCALCRDEQLETAAPYPFTVLGDETVVEITSQAKGKWMVFYR